MAESVTHTHRTSSSLSNNSCSYYNAETYGSLNNIVDPLKNIVISSVLLNVLPHLLETLQMIMVIATIYLQGGILTVCLLSALWPLAHVAYKQLSDSIVQAAMLKTINLFKSGQRLEANTTIFYQWIMYIVLQCIMTVIIVFFYDRIYVEIVSFSDNFMPYAYNSLLVATFTWGIAKSMDVFFVIESNHSVKIYLAGV